MGTTGSSNSSIIGLLLDGLAKKAISNQKKKLKSDPTKSVTFGYW
jgi:hypothetical protein